MDRSLPVYYVTIRPPTGGAQPLDQSIRITSLEFEDCEEKADKLTLSVDNFDLANFDNPVWAKGNIIEATWGYPGNMAPRRKAVITKVTGFTTLKIEALSEGYLLNEQAKNRTFENKTRSQIARQVAEEWGYSPELQHVEETNTVYPTVTQARQTDAQFLRRLAHQQGFEVYVDFDGFHFHSRDLAQRVSRTFHWYSDPGAGDILNINVENDVTAKPAEVHARARDPLTRTSTAATATNTPTSEAAVDTNGDNIPDAPPGNAPLAPTPEIQRYDALLASAAAAGMSIADIRRDFTPDMAERLVGTAYSVAGGQGLENFTPAMLAQAAATQAGLPGGAQAATEIHTTPCALDARCRARETHRRAQQTTVKITFDAVGDPQVLAKSVIRLLGISRRLSGLYYVSLVKHKLSQSGYTISVSCWSDGTQGYQRGEVIEVPRVSQAQIQSARLEQELGTSYDQLHSEFRHDNDGSLYVAYVDQNNRERWRGDPWQNEWPTTFGEIPPGGQERPFTPADQERPRGMGFD